MKTAFFETVDRQTNILNGGPDPINYDDGCQSFGELCYERLGKQGHKILLVDGATGEHVSALQLRDRSAQFARSLYAAGVRPGDRVCVSALNRLEFAYLLFGSFMCGAAVAPLNVTYTESEVQHAVSLSRPKVIFAHSDTRKLIDTIVAKNDFIKLAITFGSECVDFLQKYGRAENSGFEIQAQNTNENVALILCSSGTTGLPKGVQLTQKNVMIGIEQHAKRPQKQEKEVAPNAVILSIIPWFHAFGCLSLTCSMLNGDQIVCLPKFEANSFLMAIQNHKVNTIFMVPPLMVFLAKSPLIDQYDLSTIKVIWCGAAPLSKESQEAVEKRLGVPVIRQGYGMTEGTLALTGQTDEHHSVGSVGVIRAGLLGRVVNLETGENQPPFKTGELWFKGSVVMKGYVNDVQSTMATVDEDGWLHTGDIGYYNEAGEIFIVDRIKELIKHKGFQVPPAEIEGVLLQHPLIADAGVIGIADEAAGELPFAFVVKQPNAELTELDVIKFVAEHVSPAKRLSGGVTFVSEIPKNPSGKILRRVLRELRTNVRSKL